MILFNVIAQLSGCVSRMQIITFGKYNLKKLQKLGVHRNGIPSEPTLCRIEKGVDNLQMAQLMQCFAQNQEFLSKFKTLEHIAVDGKCMRGTIQNNGKSPDIVSAYSVDNQITLYTEMCNEITALPKIIDKMDLTKKVITGDTIFCQKKVIDKIHEKNGNFLIEVKANQKALLWGLEDNINKAKPLDIYQNPITLEHGRITSRICKTYNGLDLIADQVNGEII